VPDTSDEVRELGSDYVVVLRAPSSARFVPEGGWELNLEGIPDLGLGPVRVRSYTRWVQDGALNLPRELVIEVRAHAASLDEAVAKFATVARPIANVIGFVTNVKVGALEVHLAYDCDPASEERPLLEVFLADERGGVAEGRIIRNDLLQAAALATLALPADSPRVNRALRHYELALRDWYVGGEWLALSHLWMAVENLTEAVVRKSMIDGAVTEEELAKSLDVITDDAKKPRWAQIMRERVRERLIFGGDHDTYKTAKGASDGLEHGYIELNTVAEHALESADMTFHCVRRTIVELLRLPDEVTNQLMTITPMDVQSLRKIIRGRMIGAAADPAQDGEMYPRLEWTSSIGSVIREGSTFQIKGQEQLTVRTHPDIKFQFDSIEVVGRLKEGHVPVELDPQDVILEPTGGVASTRLLNSVMPLVDAAVASGSEEFADHARVHAFNLFGQGVAYFQAVQTLIAGSQPVEALPSLRGLTLLAARFEQIAEPDGPGLGIVLRMALDGIDEIGADAEHTARARASAAQLIEHLGIAVPDELPDPASTAVYVSLTAEMTLARGISEATFGAVGLHVQRPDSDHLEFHTKLGPGNFTDMVASAAEMAVLDLLQHAADWFGWSLDVSDIGRLLATAKEMNDASASADCRSMTLRGELAPRHDHALSVADVRRRVLR